MITIELIVIQKTKINIYINGKGPKRDFNSSLFLADDNLFLRSFGPAVVVILSLTNVAGVVVSSTSIPSVSSSPSSFCSFIYFASFVSISSVSLFSLRSSILCLEKRLYSLVT